ncbi:MAG: C-GCAxxG-C-C family protein [Thermodesulfobacteriota bacterium]
MRADTVRVLAARAEELFLSREMYCAEAIVTVLNEGFGGGLERERARGLAMGFGEGLGKAGCVCGALSGAVLAASWFLSSSLPPAKVREAARGLHDAFKKEHGSSCCRVLTRHVRAEPARHFAHCAGLTRVGAELAARTILEHMPELASHHLRHVPRRGRSKAAALLRRLADRLG